MKHTCDKCGQTTNVPETDILAHIERSGALRARVARLLGRLTGSQGGKRSLQTMTPEQRQQRARNAVAAREQKRAKRVQNEN